MSDTPPPPPPPPAALHASGAARPWLTAASFGVPLAWVLGLALLVVGGVAVTLHGLLQREAGARWLLQQVPGLQLVAHQGPEDCCGSAGIYNLLQPDLAAEIGRRKVDSLAASGATMVATGNPGCMLQLKKGLMDLLPQVKIMHLTELLAQSIEA